MSSGLNNMATATLPCCLTVSNGSDPAHNILITVVRPLPSIHVKSLNPQIFSSRKAVWLSSASRKQFVSSHATFLVKVQTLHSDVLRHGLLVNNSLLEGAYELLEGCMEPVNLGNLGEAEDGDFDEGSVVSKLATIDEYMRFWSVSDNSASSREIDRSAFSMKPPSVPQLAIETAPVPARYTISPQNEKNPLDFILSRYFNTLYSLTTPLSYFPKTALARFKNMCNNDNSEMLEHLSRVYLSTEHLNRRRLARYGLSKQGDDSTTSPISMTRFEIENQSLLVSKHYQEIKNDELLETLVLDLKIREAQLQILLLLEIVICSNVDEESFLKENSKKQEQAITKKKKPTLIRRKRNKVIPTFLGVGVPDASDGASSESTAAVQDHVSHFSLFMSLTSLIDQIGLWDSLLDRGKADKDQNTHGFLAFVIVPYFSKSLPKLVSFIIKLFKSLRPNLSKPKISKAGRNRSKTSLVAPNSEENTPSQEPYSSTSPPVSEWTKSLSALDSLGQSDNAKTERKSKFTKTLMNVDKTPLLHRAATSIDLDTAKPTFSLKRSKSNMSTKNLKKRQVDMSIMKNDASESDSKRSSSFLFADARKIKSITTINQATSQTANQTTNQRGASSSNVCQVEATPAKPSSKSLTKEAPQVFATPSNQRTVDMNFIVEETPLRLQEKKPSVHERLSQVAMTGPDNMMSIVSSPVRDSEDGNIFSHGRLDPIEASSPIKAVMSSPVHIKSKPGQQISLRQSPFYNNQLSGSPPPVKQSEARDSPLTRKKGTLSRVKSAPKSTRKERIYKERIYKERIYKGPKTASLGNAPSSGTSDLSLNGSIGGPQTVGGSSGSEPVKTATKNTPSFSGTDTDSDSDYERLLASVQKPATKKYIKKRTF
ncbi:hypothetical protein JCM33374_g2283 [Metschnikowia sp. JCM 33374]|nr:hypothetical protein JCM33374_g2283 [Metschnikowia sp. JCM 33374]